MPKIHKVNILLSCYLLLIYVVIGFFQKDLTGFSLAQLYMGFFTVLLFIGFLKVSPIEPSVVLLLFFWLFISSNIINLINANTDYIIEKFILLQKFIFTFISYFYFKNLFKKGYNSNFKFFLKLHVIAIIITISISLLGAGSFAYSDGVGTIGLFKSGNELSYVVLLILGNLLFFVWKNNKKYFVLTSLGAIFAAILFGMKVIIVGVILLVILLSFKKKSMLYGLMVSIIIVSGSLTLYLLFGELADPVFLRFIYKYKYSDSFLDFLLSQRDLSLVQNWLLYERSNIWQLLFGMPQANYTEMDFFTVLFNFGIVGFFIIYGFFLLVIINQWKKQQKEYRKYFLFFNLLVLSISMIAGHFVFSALAGFYFAYFNSIIYKKDIHQINNLNIISDRK